MKETYYATLKTKQNDRLTISTSPSFNNRVEPEQWLKASIRQARKAKLKIVDHYLSKEF